MKCSDGDGSCDLLLNNEWLVPCFEHEDGLCCDILILHMNPPLFITLIGTSSVVNASKTTLKSIQCSPRIRVQRREIFNDDRHITSLRVKSWGNQYLNEQKPFITAIQE